MKDEIKYKSKEEIENIAFHVLRKSNTKSISSRFSKTINVGSSPTFPASWHLQIYIDYNVYLYYRVNNISANFIRQSSSG